MFIIVFRNITRRTKINALEQSLYPRQIHRHVTCTKKLKSVVKIFFLQMQNGCTVRLITQNRNSKVVDFFD